MRLIDADEVTNKILYLLQGGVPSQDIRRGIKKIYTMLCDAPTVEYWRREFENAVRFKLERQLERIDSEGE